ncbi:MAG: MFS transporter [Rhodospirillaceae bacterium]|jgi:ATP:ADP antiporter, AAA family|nr:MFS transporter [Rhodospirillaceae bacterium]MBT5566582.1 MFS transporter [Rhodospirillaceae bacterium]MBT6090671.1 MFS transporter [Rhodospirillaceae bacterium]MBT6960152.1 MFS transporter [Rhodospirillaceae bacterium]
MSPAVENFFKRTAKIESHELRAVLVSFVYLFCLMASYYTMRPLRDALASEVASEDLKFLWTGTFVASTLAALVFGWVVSRYKVSSCLPWIYGFFIINIGIFYVLMGGYPLGSTDTMTAPVLNTWPIVLAEVKVSTVVACVYYVWLSVFNMFVVSVFWSFLADRYSKDQSKRLFGFVAAGGSAGAALGPLATAAIVTDVGVENMLLIAAIVLSITLICIRDLTRHTHGGQSEEQQQRASKVGGSAWSGFAMLFKDPYLIAIAVFVMLYTFISTIFYVAQVDLVRAAFETREARYAVNAVVDGVVNGLAIFTQLFVTSRIAGKWGFVFLLACMPAFMVFAFFALSAFPVLMMILSLQVVRRAGNYAMTRPGREMLWTVVDRDRKYKAKNVIDTSVYRGADLINIWIENGLRSAGFGLAQIALVGSGVAAAWCGVSIWLGKTAEKRKSEHPEGAG